MRRAGSAILALSGACAVCAACARPSPPPPTPIQSVTVAPQSTGSPNEPVLLVGPQPAREPPGDVERVKVIEDRPDAGWIPPRDRCPQGITEMMAVHVPLGDATELAAGAAPVLAIGADPGAADVVFDRGRKVVRVTAKKYGLLYVLVARGDQCTFYGVSTGY